MRVPVKLLGFVFWLFFFNCGQCRDCLREDIKYENTEPAAKASYSDGETVRLYCMTGFTGMYRLKCEEGTWDTIVERKCAKKKCSHPGDAPNGDFKLTAGSEFVFGATVLYTCKKGFEMTSRINQRTCRAQGWDNTVPVCEDCLREDIKYENTEPATKASYSDGETVRLYCMTGFTGVYRLKCEEGTWDTIVERKCAKKKCSHPGDAPNGDFKLTAGSEFVFGTTVLYTCKKGFEMTSKINHRTCRAQGWDNTVPVCEAVKCPAIRTNAFVTASGNTEEGSYGDVIHFECVSADKKIDGSSDINCTETGDWSDSVPTCKEITCTAPFITNGFVVEPVQEYQKDAILKYRCSPGFKAREGIPRCAKFGWTLKPECDEVTCELKSIRFGVQKINPEGKTIFRAGESVEITCTEGYRIFGTKETIRSFTCQENGEWDHEPVCEGEKGHWEQKKLIIAYLGMNKRQQRPCTQDGWTPKPLCAGKCGTPPNVNFADTTEMIKREYHSGEKVEYTCFNKYILDQHHPYSKYLTCEDGEWRGNIKCLKPCSVSVEKMDERGIELRWHGRENIFSPHGDRITFRCQRGKSSIDSDLRSTCNDGVMNLPRCV
ncbi:complement factor H-like isoform X4 [Chanodichthys erythropterus]|uniref:complement factor H-like isoform X4 n=1 Tax=Chanodichthys erythropterus TaxID=933992 RepID=UPI00351EB0FE